MVWDGVELVSVFLVSMVLQLQEGGCQGYDCSRVSPKWDQYNGKPFVQLADEQSLKVEVAWSWGSVLAGSSCVQAFEVEHQEFGKGRKTWSQWSSLVNCAIVVQDHLDIQEGNFTVVTPSRYEEALIQCRPIYQKITQAIPVSSIRSNLFLVRVPHRRRYQRPTRKPAIPDRATTPIPTARPTMATIATIASTATTTTSTTTTQPRNLDPIQDENGTDIRGILSMEYPIPNEVPKHIHRDTFVLLSGKFAKIDKTKKYEVRHNLKDFEATSQHLQYCGKYYVQDVSDECDVEKVIRRGMHLCLTSTNDFVPNPEVEAHQGRKFKLFVSPKCSGVLSFAQKLRQCFCDEPRSFIVA
eukprot:TCALIF_10371-PA protein Name:"Protein of unknown function" AED:0.03 eAED:0.03 QI:403/0.8/0.66/1/0.8/0.83/6/20/354